MGIYPNKGSSSEYSDCVALIQTKGKIDAGTNMTGVNPTMTTMNFASCSIVIDL
jgi:hypothetical protein